MKFLPAALIKIHSFLSLIIDTYSFFRPSFCVNIHVCLLVCISFSFPFTLSVCISLSFSLTHKYPRAISLILCLSLCLSLSHSVCVLVSLSLNNRAHIMITTSRAGFLTTQCPGVHIGPATDARTMVWTANITGLLVPSVQAIAFPYGGVAWSQYLASYIFVGAIAGAQPPNNAIPVAGVVPPSVAMVRADVTVQNGDAYVCAVSAVTTNALSVSSIIGVPNWSPQFAQFATNVTSAFATGTVAQVADCTSCSDFGVILLNEYAPTGQPTGRPSASSPTPQPTANTNFLAGSLQATVTSIPRVISNISALNVFSVDCSASVSSGGPLNGFAGNVTQDKRFRYNYWCSTPTNIPFLAKISSTTSSVSCNSWNLYSMGNLTISCSPNPLNPMSSFLTSFQMLKSNSNNCSYSFSCVSYSGNFQCRTVTGSLYGVSLNSSLTALSKVSVRCAATEVLQSVQLLTTAVSPVQYQYVCCASIFAGKVQYRNRFDIVVLDIFKL